MSKLTLDQVRVSTITDKNGTGSPTFTFGFNGYINTAIFEYQVAAGSGGGTATSGSWIKRPLNTTIRNDNSFATLSSDVITLPSGSYIFKSYVVFNNTNTSQIRIRNTTDSTTASLGLQLYLSSSSSSTGVSSLESTIITINSSKNFELQYRVSNTVATVGLGNYDSTFDENYVYARLIIEKVG